MDCTLCISKADFYKNDFETKEQDVNCTLKIYYLKEFTLIWMKYIGKSEILKSRTYRYLITRLIKLLACNTKISTQQAICEKIFWLIVARSHPRNFMALKYQIRISVFLYIDYILCNSSTLQVYITYLRMMNWLTLWIVVLFIVHDLFDWNLFPYFVII